MVNLFKKARMVATSAVLLLSLATTAATTLINVQSASAATSADCKLNIVCNGLSGSNDAGYISSFKSLYTKGSDGHYNDLKTVYNWMGANSTVVNGMNTTNTQIGTVYKDGHITVGGKTVATGAVVTARFTKGAGFTKIAGTSDVYSRKTTTYEYYNTEQAIVYMQNGKMVFFVETGCGNAGKGTPVVTPPTPPTPPAPVLTCDLLSFKQTADKAYTFTANASAKNTTITGYTFSFGDKATKTVSTGATTATADHTYAGPGTYVAYVSVSSKDKSNITSSKCAVSITIPTPPPTCETKPSMPECTPPPATPVMTCDLLTISQSTTNLHQYTFTVQGTATNATVTGYTVDFGDQTTAYTGTQPSVEHTYSKTGSMTIVATITFSANGQTTTKSSVDCTKQITVPVLCTIPGKEQYPANDTNCVETPPVTPPTTPTPPATPPTVLPNTGAGNVIGLFTGITIAGAALHRLISSRRLFSFGR